LADAFKNMADGPEKAADAVALLGRAGLNLIPFLNKGSDGIREFNAMVDEYGPNVTKNGIEKNEEWQKATEKLSLAWSSFTVTVAQDVLPMLSNLATALANTTKYVESSFNGLYKVGAAALAYAAALSRGESQAGATAAAILKLNSIMQEQADIEKKADKSPQQEQLEAYRAKAKAADDLRKAGGAAAYALEQLNEKIKMVNDSGKFELLGQLEAQIPALQAAADLEKQRAAEAERIAKAYKDLFAVIAAGPSKPIGIDPKNGALLKTENAQAGQAGVTALFGKQPDSNPAPQIGGGPTFSPIGHQFGPDLEAGQKALAEFYQQWQAGQKGTEDSINADYDAQLSKWQEMLDAQQISQQQFNAVSQTLETERQAGLKRLREDTGATTFQDAWDDTFTQLINSGKDFAASIMKDIGGAIDSLNESLAKMIVTGKKINFKKLGQGLEENATSSILKKGQSMLFGALGLGNAGKPDGSSQQQALWVQLATGIPGLSGALPGGLSLPNLPLGGLGSTFLSGAMTPGFMSGAGSAATSAGSGVAAGFADIAGLFADGGDVTPGKNYIVGEQGPEVFSSGTSGQIIPMSGVTPSRTGGPINMTLHVHGATNPDEFKKSAAQIGRTMSSMVAGAQARR
jgi:hypothetical protein